ncbi:two-component system sensor histidine kinase NtrB [Ampullimonas aquatilis]|uniref:two-component system sensor histidine kinase NtrB n=1 Tax=Ampullimonas aquatilis TaxID=1341549 RepID=UPI003C72F8CE
MTNSIRNMGNPVKVLASVAMLSRQVFPKSFWTSLTAFASARLVLALVMFISQFFKQLSLTQFFESVEKDVMLANGIYFLLGAMALCLALWWRHRFYWQLLGQIILDLVMLTALLTVSGGMKSGFAILYLFPVAGAAVLGPLGFPILAATTATVAMLYQAILAYFQHEAESSILQVGLLSAALFATALLMHRFAVRLIAQERLANQRGLDLKYQLEINQLVIAEMQDGVLIVKRDGSIIASNQAAQDILDLSGRAIAPYNLYRIEGLDKLGQKFRQWQRRMAESQFNLEHEIYFVLEDSVTQFEAAQKISQSDQDAEMFKSQKKNRRLRARFVEPHQSDHDIQPEAHQSIIYLEDMGRVEEQAQQLKLASMGRLTASIAHEIRNPLAAISHANALLAEEFAEADNPALYQRMTRIVQENVLRLNRIIEDVLQVSKKVRVDQEPLESEIAVREIIGDFLRDRSLDDAMVHLQIEETDNVLFDPFHLRQVVMNLMVNAQRYASGKPGSIVVRLNAGVRNRLELTIKNDGPEIPSEVRQHLFEPFFTTAAKGTGLGLYLARELCISNGAEIYYRSGASMNGATPRPRVGGEFVISLKRWQTKWSDTLPLGRDFRSEHALDLPTIQRAVQYTEQPSSTDNRYKN